MVDSPHPLLYRAVAGFVQRCVTAPETKQPGGPSGWAFIFTDRAEFELLAPNADADVLGPFIDQYGWDPCGQVDFALAMAANIALAPMVHVPDHVRAASTRAPRCAELLAVHPRVQSMAEPEPSGSQEQRDGR